MTRHVRFGDVNVSISALGAISVKHNSGRIIIFISPEYTIYRRLVNSTGSLISSCAFGFVIVPTLNTRSGHLTGGLCYTGSGARTLSTLVGGALNSLPSGRAYSPNRCSRALLATRFVKVRNIPFIITPSNHIDGKHPGGLGS